MQPLAVTRMCARVHESLPQCRGEIREAAEVLVVSRPFAGDERMQA
jgi:hypothetical protein